MDFLLFLLVNALLFLRPGDVVPELEWVPFYQLAIVTTGLFAFPRVLEQLRPQRLVERPVTLLVLGLLAAAVLSGLANGALWNAREGGETVAKLVIYYLLLVAVVNSPTRLRCFLIALAVLISVLTTLSLLQYFDQIDVPAFAAIEEAGVDRETGAVSIHRRLCGAGIFHDPNDFCLLLVIALAVSVYEFTRPGRGLSRSVWLVAIGLLGSGLLMTKSRGGLLAVLSGICVLLAGRLGGKRTMALAPLLLFALLLAPGSRQTSLTLQEGTGQDRIQLWSQGISALRQSPLFGIGMGRYQDEFGLVAHNSFVNGYTELGFFGGTLFLGMFGLALLDLYRLGSAQALIPEPELRRLRPYLTALVAGFAVGLLSLSRVYFVPTYLVLGLATAYAGCVGDAGQQTVLRFNVRLAWRLPALSAAFLGCTYGFVRLFVQWH